jgi:hypothetical protein
MSDAPWKSLLPLLSIFTVLVPGNLGADPGVDPAQPRAEAPPAPVGLAGALTPPAAAELGAATASRPRRFRIYAGAQIVSQYVSRGLVFSDQPSFQPWVEVDIPLLREPLAGADIQALAWFFGNWNSLQEGGPGLGQARTGQFVLQDNWYEADLYTGLRARFADRWTTSFRINHYRSPSDSFGSIDELDWRISYDDSAFWEERFGWKVAFYPSVRVAREVDDSGGAEQWYVQPSLAPVLVLDHPVPLKLTFPFAAGFGGNGQYVAADGEDRRFGFVQGGMTFELPLASVPEDWGDWSLSGGGTVVFLADRDLSFRGDRFESVFHLGLAAAF